MLREREDNPIGLYVHIPFCKRRCDYCDFATTVGPKAVWQEYADRLLNEMSHWRNWLSGRAVHSVYFGGGTPSLIGGEPIARILDTVRENFDLLPGAEISLEANPETVDEPLIEALVSAGVNRLSVGVQSFQPLLLEKLNRLHSEEDVCGVFDIARRAGLENLSIDLIYGIPGQTLAMWREDLAIAAQLAVRHVSCYELTLESTVPMGQRVASGEEVLPDESAVVEMYEDASEFLPSCGLKQYEISNFAAPGFECRHNLEVWRQGEYLGVGMAAHSHLDGRRFRNPNTLSGYLNREVDAQDEAPGHYELRWLGPGEQWSEALILGLRTVEGVDLTDYRERLAADPPGELQECLGRYEQRGLLERDRERFRLTPAGRLLSDCVFAELVG